ncbi:MAG: hypothetical protein KC912_10985 [Proteobacteria bacterium]|nr:hypothetical protein [Pseudomonadota bacterium]
MAITRRHVLAALAGTAAVSTLGAGSVAWSWWDRAPAADLKALSADEFAFVQALAEAWMPPGGEPSLSGAEAGVGHFMDDLVAAMHPAQGKELKLLMQLLDDLTVPLRFSRYANIDLARRTEILAGWLNSENHFLRSGVQALIALIASGYTMHPEIAKTMRTMYRCGYGA